MLFNVIVFGFIYVLPIIPFIIIMIWYMYSKGGKYFADFAAKSRSYDDLKDKLKGDEKDWMDKVKGIPKEELASKSGKFMRDLNFKKSRYELVVRNKNPPKEYMNRVSKGMNKIANKVKDYIKKNT